MKHSTRRTFIGSSAAAAGAVLSSNSALGAISPDTQRPPIVHHVFFWLKNPSSADDRDQLVAGLKTLAGIPLIKEIYVGILAATEKRDVVDSSWQVSELMFFNDLHSQASYQQHPIHLDFVKNYSHLWEKVVVYDTMNLFNRVG